MKVLVTGANGFVGHALCNGLRNQGHDVVAAVRRTCNISNTTVITNESAWYKALTGQDTLVHTAARTHVMNERETDALSIYRATNVEGTVRLAEMAAEAGIRRFIFISSIKVNGERTHSGTCFSHEDEPHPVDFYGISKWEAEQELWKLAENSAMEISIIRPPMVYGPRVKGNFLTLLDWLYRSVPLPLSAVRNRRSLIGITNLVDVIGTCITHTDAANQTFLVSDDEDLSTSELLRRLSKALDKPSRLFRAPPPVLQLAAELFGRRDAADRLLGNLQIDISRTKEILDWNPPVTVNEGFLGTAEWYLSSR